MKSINLMSTLVVLFSVTQVFAGKTFVGQGASSLTLVTASPTLNQPIYFDYVADRTGKSYPMLFVECYAEPIPADYQQPVVPSVLVYYNQDTVLASAFRPDLYQKSGRTSVVLNVEAGVSQPLYCRATENICKFVLTSHEACYSIASTRFTVQP